MSLTSSTENKQTNKVLVNAKPLWFDTVQLNDPLKGLGIASVTMSLKVAMKATY